MQQPAFYDAAPVVAHATPDQRAAFITRTYLHLVGAILMFVALETFWFVTPVAAGMISFLQMSKYMWLIVMAGFVGTSYLADRWAQNSTSVPLQYAGLGLYTVLQSLLFLPLIAMAIMLGAQGDENILSKAAMITSMLFISLTGIVFITRKDFSFLRGILMFGGIAAMGFIVASIVFGFTLGMFFSYAMVAFACGYILYDTSNVMLRYRTSQHVAAALALFASVMLLFWYVLRILIDRRR
ncbi:MAG TPA: Bax inhibitor-1 family protein [Polyangiales bacterium]|nr:Bax inhibitor-1 family protein [Polyangiales bacterium]HMI90633.1 Bax inhibitor-1 family protein [Polyangiales bacterium]